MFSRTFIPCSQDGGNNVLTSSLCMHACKQADVFSFAMVCHELLHRRLTQVCRTPSPHLAWPDLRRPSVWGIVCVIGLT